LSRLTVLAVVCGLLSPLTILAILPPTLIRSSVVLTILITLRFVGAWRNWLRFRVRIDQELRPDVVSPVGNASIRLGMAVVFHHRSVGDPVSGRGPQVGRNHQKRRHYRAHMLSIGLPSQAFIDQLIATKDPIFEACSRQCEVWVSSGNLHGGRHVWRHPHHLLRRLHNPHLRRHVADHFDSMPNFFCQNLVSPSCRQLHLQLIAVDPWTGTILIEAERKIGIRDISIRMSNCEIPVALAIAAEVDPCISKRETGFRSQKNPRALQSPNVALPLDHFGRSSGVLGKLVSKLPNEQRRHIDKHDPDRVGAAISSDDAALCRAVHPAVATGQDRLKDFPTCHRLATGHRIIIFGLFRCRPATAANHRHQPGCGHVHAAITIQRGHADLRLLTATTTTDRCSDDQLATALQRHLPGLHIQGMQPPVSGLALGWNCLPRKLGVCNPHSGGWQDPRPGNGQPQTRHHQIFRGQQLIQTGEGHEGRQHIGECHKL
jgi:hypothetical protein